MTSLVPGCDCGVVIAPSRDLEMLRRHRSRSADNRPRTAPPTHNEIMGMYVAGSYFESGCILNNRLKSKNLITCEGTSG